MSSLSSLTSHPPVLVSAARSPMGASTSAEHRPHSPRQRRRIRPYPFARACQKRMTLRAMLRGGWPESGGAGPLSRVLRAGLAIGTQSRAAADRFHGDEWSTGVSPASVDCRGSAQSNSMSASGSRRPIHRALSPHVASKAAFDPTGPAWIPLGRRTMHSLSPAMSSGSRSWRCDPTATFSPMISGTGCFTAGVRLPREWVSWVPVSSL
jgi:hypothetical protein